ncbi:helix-turn-helix domain-containing protein [bacterium]|nr:helix-turn-helix domain-containing protein [bacterium]
MNWYERVRERREQLKITQAALAKMVGYKSPTTITKIETGKTDIPSSQLLSISRALNCSPVWILGLSDNIYGTNKNILLPKEYEMMEVIKTLSEECKEKVLEYSLLLRQAYKKK